MKKNFEYDILDVENFEVKLEENNVVLTWNLKDRENISQIIILKKMKNIDRVFKKIAVFKEAVEEFQIKEVKLAKGKYKIKLMYKNGELSSGKELDFYIPHKDITEDECSGKRMLIYLPKTYNETDKTYPVMYMLDGQNLFSTAYLENDWGIDRTVERLVKENKIEETIVVGIFNAGEKRLEEYTAYFYEEGKEFAEKLTKKIIPYIESKYRINKNRESRGIMGSSRGGLAAVYIINNYSEYFGFAGGISASEKWKWKEYKDFPKNDVKIWLDNGTADYVLEYSRNEAVREMTSGYINQGHRYGESIVFYEVKDAGHNEIDWSKRVEYPFIMFSGKDKGKLLDFNIDLEVFYDNSDSPVYVVNPVGEFENGIRYSLYSNADYSISGAAKINDTGIFRLNGEKEIEIEISYENIRKSIKTDINKLEDLRDKNFKAKGVKLGK